LLAISLDGIIWAKVVEGSFTAALFYEFIEELLTHMEPFPGRNSVIVMDNARIHKHPDIIELIESQYVCSLVCCLYAHFIFILFRGMRVLFLPPYSPDYNPIELAFSAIKSYVKREQVLARDGNDEDDTHVYTHLLQAAFAVSSDHAQGYYHKCGYL
jgi:transposase